MGEFDFWPVSKSVVRRIVRRALRRPSEEAGAVEVFGGGGLEGREGQGEGPADGRMDGLAQFALFVCLFQRDRDRLPLIMKVEELHA